MSENETTMTIVAGTIIHIHGLPFRLVESTKVSGHPENFPLMEWAGAESEDSEGGEATGA